MWSYMEPIESAGHSRKENIKNLSRGRNFDQLLTKLGTQEV